MASTTLSATLPGRNKLQAADIPIRKTALGNIGHHPARLNQNLNIFPFTHLDVGKPDVLEVLDPFGVVNGPFLLVSLFPPVVTRSRGERVIPVVIARGAEGVEVNAILAGRHIVQDHGGIPALVPGGIIVGVQHRRFYAQATGITPASTQVNQLRLDRARVAPGELEPRLGVMIVEAGVVGGHHGIPKIARAPSRRRPDLFGWFARTEVDIEGLRSYASQVNLGSVDRKSV